MSIDQLMKKLEDMADSGRLNAEDCFIVRSAEATLNKFYSILKMLQEGGIIDKHGDPMPRGFSKVPEISQDKRSTP